MTVNTKKDFSTEEIIKIVLSLGSESYRYGSGGEIIFQTVCHNEHHGNYKLYYYPDSGYFHCYTDCGDNFNIYELVKRSKGIEFIAARGYINNLLGIKSKRAGFIALSNENELIDDWDIFNKYAAKEQEEDTNDQQPHEFKHYSKTLLEFYKHVYPIEWLNEGILPDSLEKYNIRYDLLRNKIIIPHYDTKDNLIGIRGRSLNPEDSIRGKYKPVVIEHDIIRHAISQNLYGLNVNKEAIQNIKKIMIFESEKSVIKCDTFYGKGNFTVAVCGSSISQAQFETILNLRVKEVFIAFDKEYRTLTSEENDLLKNYEQMTFAEKSTISHEYLEMIRMIREKEEEGKEYAKKITKLASKFCPYITTYVLLDWEGLIDYKDSPCDKGKDVLEWLMMSKNEFTTEDT